MIFNERILRLVVTLAEDLHFGRASARLHVSQPALSGTLKNLERDLGVQLFKRSTRSVELTEAGQVFVAEARRLLEEGERAIGLVRGSASDKLGPLRIGYPSAINLRWLGSLMAAEQAEPIELRFVSTEAMYLHDDLVKGALHASFFVGWFCHPVPDLESVTLFREPFRLVVKTQHALAQSEAVDFTQLKDEPVVWLSRESNPNLHDCFIAACDARGYRPRIAQEVRSYHECLEFAREGVGVTFLPSFMQTYRDDSLAFIRLPDKSLYAEYRLATRRKAPSEEIERFVAFVREHVRNMSARYKSGPARPLIAERNESESRND
jgi:DNA-binding transcriptional LysR family regulator